MIQTSTEKKQFSPPKLWVDDDRYERAQRMPLEIPVSEGGLLPMVTNEELEKVMPLSESEEQELVEIGERLKERGFLTDNEKARAKILLKKRKRDDRFSSQPSISMDATKVFFKE